MFGFIIRYYPSNRKKVHTVHVLLFELTYHKEKNRQNSHLDSIVHILGEFSSFICDTNQNPISLASCSNYPFPVFRKSAIHFSAHDTHEPGHHSCQIC